MRTTYITAALIAAVLCAWLASGVLHTAENAPANPSSLADQNRAQSRVDEDASPTRVRVTVMDASTRNRLIKVRGKTENKRTVTSRVELSGTIVERPVERGTVVAKNDLLCRISLEDRQVALIEAQEALNQARIEYKGAISLRKKGYNSEAAIAGAKSRLASAKANLSRRQLSIAKLEVRAPFDGIVETVHREIGDYIKPGDGCATVVDMDPILLVGQVSEADVIHLALGQPATGFLRNGESVTGPVSFIGQQNDPATRTYDVEIQLSNPDLKLRSGVTTEIHIPVESILAQKISPALLSLDDLGVLGIRTIDQNNIVNFNPIEILSDAPDGIWVSGLPNRSAIITTGQALVTEGERVDPVFQNRRTLKAESSQSEMPKAEQLPDSGATATVAVMSIELRLSAN